MTEIPKKYQITKEQEDLIIDLAIQGETLKDIADQLFMTSRHFYEVRQHNPNLQVRLNAARREACEDMADTLLGIADDMSIDPHRARLKSDNIKWVLAKRKPDVYGDKLDLNVTGHVDITGAITEARKRIRDVSPTELNGSIDNSDN